MGLSVSLGLGRFYAEVEATDWEAALIAIVETGSVDLIRDVITDDLATVEDARVFEVSRTENGIQSRYLPEDDAQKVVARIQSLFAEHKDQTASFSWDQAENLAYDIQDLAVRYAEGADPMTMHSVHMNGLANLISLERSMRSNWASSRPKSSKFARAMHELAQELFLPVHSA